MVPRSAGAVSVEIHGIIRAYRTHNEVNDKHVLIRTGNVLGVIGPIESNGMVGQLRKVEAAGRGLNTSHRSSFRRRVVVVPQRLVGSRFR